MKTIIKHIIRGAGNLPYVGDHPGTIILLAFSFSGFISGGLVGLVIMLVFFLPLYLYGAYDRSVSSNKYERLES